MMGCERCQEPAPTGFDLFDYCATCNKTLCDECMKKGCCGKVPAESGADADHGEEDE